MPDHYLIRYLQTGTSQEREALRTGHIAYRKALGDDLVLAGRLQNSGGEAVGSVIVIRADSFSDAERVAGADPMVAGGVLCIDTIEGMRIAAITLPRE